MIYDLLKNRTIYQNAHKGLDLGLAFLADTDFSKLEDGRYDIDGDRVFANVMHYETKVENPTPEVHQAYIDIQYVIEGEELIGVAPLCEMEELAVDCPEGGDIWLYRGKTQPLTLGRGRFLAVWPEDAHAPGIAPDGKPAPARKCVVKVLVDMD